MHLGIIKITYNRTAQPRCYHNAFYGWQFHEPRRGGNSDFAMTIWRFWISDCKYVLLLFQVFAIDCSNAEFCASCVCVCVCVRERDRERARETGSHHSTSAILIAACVCVCVRERETGSHHSGVYSLSEIVLIAACLQTRTSIITRAVTVADFYHRGGNGPTTAGGAVLWYIYIYIHIYIYIYIY